MLKRNKSNLGFIYVFSDTNNNAVRIGFTTNLEEKVEEQKKANPFLKLLLVYSECDAKMESIVREELRQYLISGTTEWYKGWFDRIRMKLDRVLTSEQEDEACLYTAQLLKD